MSTFGKRCGAWLTALASIMLAGCGTPQFLVARDEGGPTVALIVGRITCELADLVRNEGEFGKYGDILRAAEYEVAVSLSLLVTEKGELAPNFNFPAPPNFAFNIGAAVSRTREQNFTQNLHFTMTEISDRVATIRNYARCPSDDGFLQGDLGIRETAMLAFTAPSSNLSARLNGTQGEFGGYVSFVLSRNINGVGPTWQLTRFRGPGSLGTLSRADTNKITFAFAPTKGGNQAAGLSPTPRARDLLSQLLLSQIASAVSR